MGRAVFFPMHECLFIRNKVKENYLDMKNRYYFLRFTKQALSKSTGRDYSFFCIIWVKKLFFCQRKQKRKKNRPLIKVIWTPPYSDAFCDFDCCTETSYPRHYSRLYKTMERKIINNLKQIFTVFS